MNRPELDAEITACETCARNACRDHDAAAEWEAETRLWALYEEREALDLPKQGRK